MSLQAPLAMAGLILALGACTATGDGGSASDVESSDGQPPGAQAPQGAEGAPDTAGASHAEPVVLDATPASVIAFEPFGPVPGTTDEQLAAWTALVQERFLGDPDAERVLELDTALAELDIVDATPAYLNAIRGLDMARGMDVVRCSALVQHWYVAQAKFQQIQVNGDGSKTGPAAIQSRLTAVDGWVRWWTRKLTKEGSLDRYRTRVAGVLADLERIRKERREMK